MFLVYSTGLPRQSPPNASEKLSFRDESITFTGNIMGDKSPKSVNKKATQKQSRVDAANQARKQAEIAKSAAGKKR